jgi:hypothetical protein
MNMQLLNKRKEIDLVLIDKVNHIIKEQNKAKRALKEYCIYAFKVLFNVN